MEAIIFTSVLCIQNAFFLFLYGVIVPTAATNCYAPNGGLIDFFTYLPCNESGSGPCCSNADMCLSNGLCFDSGADNIMAQAGCTDPGFNAAGCVIICSSNVGVPVYPCPDAGAELGKPIDYCCGDNCCSTGVSTFTIPIGTVVREPIPTTATYPFPTSSSSTITEPSLSSATTSSSSSSSSPTAQTTPSSSPSNSKALLIGLAVGVPLAALLIAAFLLVFRELRRHNSLLEEQRREGPAPPQRPPPAPAGPAGGGQHYEARRPVEAPGSWVNGDRAPVEAELATAAGLQPPRSSELPVRGPLPNMSELPVRRW